MTARLRRSPGGPDRASTRPRSGRADAGLAQPVDSRAVADGLRIAGAVTADEAVYLADDITCHHGQHRVDVVGVAADVQRCRIGQFVSDDADCNARGRPPCVLAVGSFHLQVTRSGLRVKNHL